MPTTVAPRAPSLPEKNALLTSDPHLYECFKKIEEFMRQMASWASNLQVTTTAAAAAAAPAVLSISPAVGSTAGGTAVTITGTGFVDGASVLIGGVAATSVVVVSSTSITAVDGAHAAGAVDVVVSNADGQSGTLAGGFTYATPPTVSAISPVIGNSLGGTPVTIDGTDFVSGATVTVGGVACTSVVFVSAIQLTAVTGAHAAGLTSVVVTNPDTVTGSLPNAFTYVAPAPFITAQTLGTAINGYDLYTGYIFDTGVNTPTISRLARWKIAGNSGTHNLYLYKYVDGVGGDVQIATASVDTTLGTDGDYQWAAITPVTLLSGTQYYVISQETIASGDFFYDSDTTVDATDSSFGTLSANCQTATLGSLTTGAPGTTYGPVNMDYTTP